MNGEGREIGEDDEKYEQTTMYVVLFCPVTPKFSN